MVQRGEKIQHLLARCRQRHEALWLALACLDQTALLFGRPVTTHDARVGELADAGDLGTSRRLWVFNVLAHLA